MCGQLPREDHDMQFKPFLSPEPDPIEFMHTLSNTCTHYKLQILSIRKFMIESFTTEDRRSNITEMQNAIVEEVQDLN